MSNYFEYHNAWGASASFYACCKKKKGVPLVIFLPENKSVMESVKNELELFSDLKILDYLIHKTLLKKQDHLLP